MKKEWVESQISAYNQQINQIVNTIADFFCNGIWSNWYNADTKKELMEIIETMRNSYEDNVAFVNESYFIINSNYWSTENKRNMSLEEFKMAVHDLQIDTFVELVSQRNRCLHYLDSEPIEFKNGIVITDPCYIAKGVSEEDRNEYYANVPKRESFMRYPSIAEYPDYCEICKNIGTSDMYDEDMIRFNEAHTQYEEAHDDWVRSNYGEDFEAIGIPTNIVRDTIYGDWSCGVFKEIQDGENSSEQIGEFCADAGMVIVADYDEVEAYNPNFVKEHTTNSYSATIIKDWQGTVQFVVTEYISPVGDKLRKSFPEKYKNVTQIYSYNLHVVGKGIIKSTGEIFNFYTEQTGF